MKRKLAAVLMAAMLTVGAAGCSGTAAASADASADTAEGISAEENGESSDADSAYTVNEDGMTVTADQEVGYDGMKGVYGSSLNPGTYEIEVDSSSSMFVITSCELTVYEDGTMTAKLVLSGTGYGYLFMGTGDEAETASEEEWIADEASEDENNTFTVPVEMLNEGLSCAAYSIRNDYWYDRTLVFRADSLPEEAIAENLYTTAEELGLEDGSYTAEVTLSGGSGKASVDSPASLVISDGRITASIVWSSPNYDYMVVNDVTYYPVNDEGNSVFEIPVDGFDFPMTVLADTTAMSQPYEIEYTLLFYSSSIEAR